MKNSNQLITVYTSSEFLGNINKHEGRLIDLGEKKYAQYNGAPYVDFIPKRKRKGVRLLKTYNPYLVVLAGVGHPEPDSMCPPAKEGEVFVKARYASFDEGWTQDFDSLLDSYLETSGAEVLMDARHTKGFSSYQGSKPLEKLAEL